MESRRAMQDATEEPDSVPEPPGDDTTPVVATVVNAQTFALMTIAILAILYTLSVAAEIVVPVLLAMMLKLLLQPAMRFLSSRLHLPVGVSALLLIVGLFALVAGLGTAIVVPASGWIAKAPQGLQTMETQLGMLRGPLAAAQYLLQRAENLARPPDASGVAAPPAAPAAAPASTGLASVGFSILLGTQHFVGRLFVLLVSLFFMLAAGDSMLRKLVEVVPRFHEKKRVVYITNEIERNVSGYLATITVINAGVGVLTGVTVYACGISDPLLWGTVAFLLNYIPILGPLIGIATIFLVGLLTFEHVVPALLPAAIYLAFHIIEGQLVTPMLLARQFTLSPLVVILSLFFWNWMWGIPGALLSVPLLAILKIVCDRIPSLAGLGHMLGPHSLRSTPGPEPQTAPGSDATA